MPGMDEKKHGKKEHIDYPMVEAAIVNLMNNNQRPTVDKIKAQLKIKNNTLDQIIEYYSYMWEQRHTVTYLDNIQPLKASELQTKDFAKRTVQLEESLAMMRATIEATEDCLLMINKEGKLIGFNKRLVDFVRLPESVRTSKDETEGLNYLFGQIADPQELANLVRKKYQDPIPGSCGEMEFKDGRVVERYYQPQIVNGNVVGHVWSLRDVTEKRKQEEELRLTKRAMTASTHCIILIENNPEHIINYINPAGLSLFIMEEPDAVQKPFLTTIDGFSEYSNQFLEILNIAKKGELTIQCRIGNKVLWLEINIDPVYEKDQSTISHFV